MHGVFNNQIPGEFDILVPRRPGLFRFGPHGRTVTLGLDREGLAQNMFLMNLAITSRSPGMYRNCCPICRWTFDLRAARFVEKGNTTEA